MFTGNITKKPATVNVYHKQKFQIFFLTLYCIDTHFDTSTTEIFENIVGHREIASNKQFLHFPQCFLFNQIIVPPFVHIFDIISLVAFVLEDPKIGISGQGLIPLYSLCLLALISTFFDRRLLTLCLTIFTSSTQNILLKRFNPFPNKPRFLRVSTTNLLKTFWEKEKLLVTSNFSFFQSVFYPFEELAALFIQFEIVVCKLFGFRRV